MHGFGEPSLPPEVRAEIAREPEEELDMLVRAWHLAGHYGVNEPAADVLAALGEEIWANLEPVVRADAADSARAPRLRLVKAPLRLVSAPALRWTAAAACLALLLAVGLLLRDRSVTLSAPAGDIAQVTLPDGSHIELNSGSTLSYHKSFDAEKRAVRLVGEAFFDVAEDDKPFVVETFNGTTTVLGTEFNVRAWPNEANAATEVTVVSGTVRLSAGSDASRSVVLEAGEAARLQQSDETPHPLKSTEFSLQNALAWREGGFKFADEPLAVVVDELERRYGVQVRVTPESLLGDRVATLLENPLGAEEIIRDICEYNGYRYRAIPGGFEIYRPGAE